MIESQLIIGGWSDKHMERKLRKHKADEKLINLPHPQTNLVKNQLHILEYRIVYQTK